jgi:hypothetical protein
LEELKGHFRGMGSLNDVVFCPENHNIPEGFTAGEANREIAKLLDRNFREASLFRSPTRYEGSGFSKRNRPKFLSESRMHSGDDYNGMSPKNALQRTQRLTRFRRHSGLKLGKVSAARNERSRKPQSPVLGGSSFLDEHPFRPPLAEGIPE